MRQSTITVKGKVIPGYRVASQPSGDYPYGTIDRQKPFFKHLGLDLDWFYSGTINIAITPLTFALKDPEFTFRQVEWTDLHPPEDFSFSHCKVIFKRKKYEALVYYPHPETKKRHFENNSILELIAVYIPDLKYGDLIKVELRADEILIRPANA